MPSPECRRGQLASKIRRADSGWERYSVSPGLAISKPISGTETDGNNIPDLELLGLRVADQSARIFAFCVWNSASVSNPSFLSSPSFCNRSSMSSADNNAAVGMMIQAMR